MSASWITNCFHLWLSAPGFQHLFGGVGVGGGQHWIPQREKTSCFRLRLFSQLRGDTVKRRPQIQVLLLLWPCGIR